MNRDVFNVRLLAALAIVFGVKLAVLLQLGDHPLLQPSAAGGLDSQYYLQLAERVAAGDLLLAPGLYFVSPLYIYFLAVLLAIGGGSLFFVKVVQIALGTAACALVWFTAREWFGERAAWFALTLAALAGAFTFYEVLILQAALDPVLAAADIALLTLALKRPAWGWAIAAGAALGVHSLNRPNMLLAAAGLACVLLARRGTRARLLPFAAGAAIALLSISLRNAVAAGTFSPVPSHGGLNFYIGNNPDADGTYHSVPGITPNIAGQAEDARRVAEAAEGRALTDAQVSAYFTRQGLGWWRNDPGAAARLLARKLAYTLNRAWLTLNYSYPFYRGESAVLGALAVGPLILVPLGLLGLWAHPIAGRAAPERFWIFASIVPLTIVSIAIFFVASRYRIPLLVPLCVTAGGALGAVLEALRQRRGRALVLVLAGAVPVAALAAWDFGLDDGRRSEQTQMALAMIDERRWDEAERWIAVTAANHPAPGTFQVAIGEAFAQAGRPDHAIPHFEEARRLGVLSARATIDLATAYASSGRQASAVELLRTVSPDPRWPASTCLRLGRFASQLGERAVAERFYHAAAKAQPPSGDAFEQLGLLLAGEGRWTEAIAALEQAVRLTPSQAATHLNLAVAYAETGRVREAREEALRALAADPGYQRAKDLLAALGR